jgi:hypothetical protein
MAGRLAVLNVSCQHRNGDKVTKIPRREVIAGGFLTALVSGVGGLPLIGSTNVGDQSPGQLPKSYSIPSDCPLPVSEPSRDGLKQADAEMGDLNVSNGRKPFPRDTKAWKAILKQFASLYSPFSTATLQEILTNSHLDGELNGAALGVSSGFKWSPIPSPFDSFRPQQVDLLLNQAADILDRCLRDRLEWEDKQVKWVSLAIEVIDFLQRDEIHNREIEAGLYTTPFTEATYERQAINSNYQGIIQANYYLCGLFDLWLSSNKEMLYQDAQALMAFLSVFPFVNSEFTWGQKKTAGDHAKVAAQGIAQFNFEVQKLPFLAAYTRSDYEKVSAAYHEMAAAERQLWLKRDVEFQRQRTLQARQLMDLRVRLAVEKDGPYNYREKMDVVSERINRNFGEAVQRLQACATGLETIYAFKNPLPTSVLQFLPNASDSSGNPSSGILDECVEWVRQSIAWIIRFSNADQSCVITVSVRQHITDQAWTDGLRTGGWSFKLRDDFPSAEEGQGEFFSMNSVRIAGISASVVGPVNGLWKASVRPPTQSTYTQITGKKVQVDQKDIPMVVLGRIGTRQLLRDPDWVGKSSLKNYSPIGKWLVWLGDRSSRNESRGKIEDVELDIEVIYQPNQGYPINN